MTNADVGSSLKLVGRVKAGQVFQLEFFGPIARLRGRAFTLYDSNERPVAVLLSDLLNQPEFGMDWYWWGKGKSEVLTIGNMGPTSKLTMPSPLDPGNYKLCSSQPPIVCAIIPVTA